MTIGARWRLLVPLAGCEGRSRCGVYWYRGGEQHGPFDPSLAAPSPHALCVCVFPSPPAHVQRRQAGCVQACLRRCRSTPRRRCRSTLRRRAWGRDPSRRGGTRLPPQRDRPARPKPRALQSGGVALQAAGEAPRGCDRRMVRLARVGGLDRDMKKSVSAYVRACVRERVISEPTGSAGRRRGPSALNARPPQSFDSDGVAGGCDTRTPGCLAR